MQLDPALTLKTVLPCHCSSRFKIIKLGTWNQIFWKVDYDVSCDDGSVPSCGSQSPSHHQLHRQKSQQTTGCIQSVHAVKRNSSPQELWNTLHSCTKQGLGSPWLNECSLTSWVDASKFLVLYNSGMTSVVKAQIENHSSVEVTSAMVHFLLPQCQTQWCAHSMICHTCESPASLCTWFVVSLQRKILSLFLQSCTTVHNHACQHCHNSHKRRCLHSSSP